MIAEAKLEFVPAASYLRVRITPPAETAGGLYVPEVSRRRPPEGTVVAVGPGKRIPGSEARRVIWPSVGDLVLFDLAQFTEITSAFDGLVSADDVIGVIDPETGVVTPENDFVVIDPDGAETETKGGVLLAERSRKRARSGVVRGLGPGEVRCSGALTGTRRPIRAMLNVEGIEPLIGRRVWWEGRQKAYYLGGKNPCCLVRAADLILIEGDSHG